MARMMMSRGRMLAAMILFAASAALPVAVAHAEGDVWYVKASNYGLDGLTGRDEEHAWGTLQQAHDAASAGDTIYVLPGTYDQGSKTGNSLASRLVVSKQLHFVATGSADETEIVGNRPATANGYNGSGAIRCVSVTSASSGTTFTRFTFRDGGSGNTPAKGRHKQQVKDDVQNGGYEQDIKRMKDMGVKSYRFSFSWARILPDGTGKINEKGLDYYRRLIKCLKDNGIVPNATMYHWDLPYALQVKGGWGNRDIV